MARSKEEKKEEKIVHVLMNDGRNFYFGSIQAIFTKLTKNEVDATAQTLYRDGLPYASKTCRIVEGVLYRKPSNRRPPIRVIRVIE